MDERKRLKRTGFFLNIIVTALCAVAVASYFTFPLLDFTLSYTVTEEFSDFLIEKMGTKDAEEGSQEDVMNTFITELGKENMVLTVPLKLQTSFFVNQILKPDETEARAVIDKLIDDAVESASEDLDGVTKTVTKSVVKAVLKVQLKNNMAEITVNADADVQEILDDIGIDDEYIDGVVDNVIDEIMSETATAESVTDTLMNVVDDMYDRLSNSDNENIPDDIELTEEKREEIKTQLFDSISAYADEDGNLNIEDKIAEILMQALGGTEGGGTGEGGSESPDRGSEGTESASAYLAPRGNSATFSIGMIRALADEEDPPESGSEGGEGSEGSTEGEGSEGSSEGEGSEGSTEGEGSSGEVDISAGEEEKEYTMDDVKDALKEKIKTAIPETINPMLVQTFKIIGYAIAVFMAIWLYIVLKIILKLFAKNPMVKFGLVKVFEWIPCFILVALPLIALTVIKSAPAALVSALGAEQAAQIAMLVSGLKMTPVSCTIISGAIWLVMIIFSFIYGHYRRKLKKLIRAEKRGS